MQIGSLHKSVEAPQVPTGVEPRAYHVARYVVEAMLISESKEYLKYLQRPTAKHPFMLLVVSLTSRLSQSKEVDEIEVMCNQVGQLLTQETSCVHVDAPVKIFGDIHGQLFDLLRLFGVLFTIIL